MRSWPLLLVLGACASGDAPNSDPLAGDWEGHWTRDGDTVLMHNHFTRTDSGYAGDFSSNALRVVGIPFTAITANGEQVSWTAVGDESSTVFTGTAHGDTLHGSFTEGDASGTFHFSRVPTHARPQSQDIRFSSGGAQLAGTVLLPAGTGPFPGVVFIHGSGAEGRWASRFLAQAFAEAGVAALIFDKRGVGASTGEWRTADFDTLAQDALAAVAALRALPVIASHRVGLHGHSQGATIAPLIAERDSTLAFVVASAASGMPADSVEHYSVMNAVGAPTMSAAERALAVQYVDAIIATAYHGAPYANVQAAWSKVADRPWAFEPPPADDPYWAFSRRTSSYDPLAHWSRVRIPALVVAGEEDERVPTHPSVERIKAAYERGTGRTLRTLLFLGADHSFRSSSAGRVWPRSAEGYPHELVRRVKELLAE